MTGQGTFTYDVAVVGAGYVGVPLAQTFADAGRRVLVLDVVPELVEALNNGVSHIEDVPSERLAPHVTSGRITCSDQPPRFSLDCGQVCGIQRAF